MMELSENDKKSIDRWIKEEIEYSKKMQDERAKKRLVKRLRAILVAGVLLLALVGCDRPYEVGVIITRGDVAWEYIRIKDWYADTTVLFIDTRQFGDSDNIRADSTAIDTVWYEIPCTTGSIQASGYSNFGGIREPYDGMLISTVLTNLDDRRY